MSVVEGVDVFDGTGTVDWTQLAGAGRQFAFIKVSQGNYNAQSRFATNWSGAEAAGLLRSPYHFFDPSVDGTAQAQWFLDHLQAGGGLTDADLPPMLDMECPTDATQSKASPNCEHSGDSGWADPATITQRAMDWLITVEQATGRKPIIYSYVSWFASLQQTDPIYATYPLFIASLNSCATVPAPWTAATFWQYSQTGTVPGIAGVSDDDRFFGDATALQQFISSSLSATTDAGTNDLATIIDAAIAPDMAMGNVDRGCQCRLSPHASTTPASFLTALVGLAFLLRQRRRMVPRVNARLSESVSSPPRTRRVRTYDASGTRRT
jgi:lysozyme